jgi:hypothetical protein
MDLLFCEPDFSRVWVPQVGGKHGRQFYRMDSIAAAPRDCTGHILLTKHLIRKLEVSNRIDTGPVSLGLIYVNEDSELTPHPLPEIVCGSITLSRPGSMHPCLTSIFSSRIDWGFQHF